MDDLIVAATAFLSSLACMAWAWRNPAETARAVKAFGSAFDDLLTTTGRSLLSLTAKPERRPAALSVERRIEANVALACGAYATGRIDVAQLERSLEHALRGGAIGLSGRPVTGYPGVPAVGSDFRRAAQSAARAARFRSS